jgi:pantoate--beta-alanine ligase
MMLVVPAPQNPVKPLVLLKTPAEARAWRARIQAEPHARVGFVPTMGALHAGHEDLLKRMRSRMGLCPEDQLVLSIFVNPAQFGPGEDLDKYPRTLEKDLEIARRAGVDAVFLPTPEQMYPPGYSTYVEENQLSQPLCGAARPGHFRGVTTVVLKLFNLLEPHVAYFGLKDAQQFFVLHKMARDLELKVSVEGIPTVREADGLAMSSRNRYLSVAERELAPALQRELRGLAQSLEGVRLLAATQGGTTPVASLVDGLFEQSKTRLKDLGFHVQYLECLSLPDLQPGFLRPDRPALLAVAAVLGTTRLIDNVILGADKLKEHGVRIHG